jgi:hypothetical protein
MLPTRHIEHVLNDACRRMGSEHNTNMARTARVLPMLHSHIHPASRKITGNSFPNGASSPILADNVAGNPCCGVLAKCGGSGGGALCPMEKRVFLRWGCYAIRRRVYELKLQNSWWGNYQSLKTSSSVHLYKGSIFKVSFLRISFVPFFVKFKLAEI